MPELTRFYGKDLQMKKKYLIVLGSVLFVFIILLVLFQNYRNPHDIDRILEVFNSTPKTYTIQQAKKDGFVDLSGVQNTKNDTVERFLNNTSENRWDVLRTVREIDNGPFITIYINDNNAKVIRSYLYDVYQQRLRINHFSQNYYDVINNDLCEIWLENIKNPFYPYSPEEDRDLILADEILYSYHQVTTS